MKTIAVALVATVAAIAAPAASANDIRVTDLEVDHREHPLGLDARAPRLAWQLESSERGQAQTAYQVLVASSERELGRDRGDVWDSGRVKSERSIDVPYGGPALKPGKRYHWKVRVWDRDGERSGWSRGDWWETGLLEPSNWQGEWIGRVTPPVLDFAGAHWIWYPEGNPPQSAPAATRYFRARFEVPAGREVTAATLIASADNEFVAYLNGEEVASGANWQRATRADVTDRLTSGTNVLAIAAKNLGGPGSLIGRLRIEFDSGEPLVLDTSSDFKAMNAEEAGWQSPGHDDSGWAQALESATYGSPPWNNGVTVPGPPVTASLFRKQLSAPKQIVRARAYVSGIGYYELRINGRRIGDHVLDPTYTEYEDTVLYSTYDVTRDLRRGPNTFEVTVAPGFYYYNVPKLRMHVAVDYADGSSAVVATDPSWEATAAPTSFTTGHANEVFGGEIFDATAQPQGWLPAKSVAPPGGRLVAQPVEPVKVAETVKPVAIAEPRPGVYVLDMGRTLTGWIRLRASGAAGSKASIQYGEKLFADGTVNDIPNPNPGPRPRWQRDDYVFRGDGEETWEPSFTFKSFRYVQITGLATAPDLDDVRGRVVHTAVANSGEFSSSSQLYDRIHQAMRRATLGGMLGYPAIDPAHEKNGWAGDMQLIAPSMVDNFGVAAYLSKWLGDVRDGQRADGSVSMINPIRDGCCYARAPEWTAAYPIVAWEIYLRYGDRGVLESHYDALVRYFAEQTASLVDGIAPPSIWGDWASPGYDYGPEDRRLTATAYVYRQAEIMRDIATTLGREADATGFQATADEVRDRFNEVFLNEAAGRYETASDPGYRQASNAIPLAFGMVPAAQRDAVLASLVDDVRARDNHLNTGILGTPALLESLTAGGHADLAHAIASQTTYPSWGQWIEAGADTIWEGWGLDGRSRNHPMHGSVDDWFYREVAGIAPDAPGFKRILIQPHPGPLTKARAEHESPYGEIESAWSVRDGSFTLDVTIPPNTTATVLVPVKAGQAARPVGDASGVQSLGVSNGYAEFRVGSGRYRFVAATG